MPVSRDLSIKIRLYMISAVGFLTLLAVLAVAGYVYSANRQSALLIEKLENLRAATHITLRGVNETLLSEGSGASLKLTADGGKEVTARVAEIRAQSPDARILGLVNEKLEPAAGNLAKSVEAFLAIPGHAADNDDALIALGKITTEGGEVLNILKETHAFASAASAKSTQRSLAIGLAIAALILGGGVLLTVLTQRSVSRSIDDLRTAMGRVREKCDLTVRAVVTRHDEIGSVGDNLNGMLGNFQGVVQEMRDNADRVLSSAGDLSTVAKQVLEASAEQSSAAATTATAVNDISSRLEDVTRLVEATDTTSRAASEVAARGKIDAQGAVEEMARIAKSVKDLSEQVSGLAQRSNEISNIIGVIKDIAEQTNLLALNAAIEAARAGEQGRGFAVVADEVRKLAERTTSATADIGGIIEAIQQDMSGAVTAMTSAHDQVDRGSERIGNLGKSFAEIAAGSVQTSTQVAQISVATREQNQVVSKIAANVEEISHAAEENSQVIQSVTQSVLTLEKLAADMRNYLSKFQV